MPFQRFIFVLALFVFSTSVASFAQTDDDAAIKEKPQRERAFLERVLEDAKNLRLSENRAFVYARVGDQLWQSDEKRARQLFQNAVNDLIAAQTEVEAEKAKNNALDNLLYGQSPRWDILHAIASRDAELALDAMLKTRPAKIRRALANYTGDYHSPSQSYARNELQSEQRLIALAADQNPERAVKLLRDGLKKEISYEAFNLLRKIHLKDSATANQLLEEIGGRLLDAKLDENNQDMSLLQNFVGEYGIEKPKDANSMRASDALTKSLTDKIVKFILRPNATSFYLNESVLPAVERFYPASVAPIKEKQAKIQNQNQTPLDQSYTKLMQSDASPDEFLTAAEKFSSYQKRELYRRAAEKTAQIGDLGRARRILTENIPEEEVERYLSQLDQTLFYEAVGRGDFDEAAALINRMTDENARFNNLLYLANVVYQKNPAENRQPAAAFLDQARGLLPVAPEKIGEMTLLINLASAYANIKESAPAFALLESLVAPLNEIAEANAVVANYSDARRFRRGESQLNQAGELLCVYNVESAVQALTNADFERGIHFTNSLSRRDVRIGLQMQLRFSIAEVPLDGKIFVFESGGGSRHGRNCGF